MNRAQRAQLIDAVLDALLDAGQIDEDQLPEEQERLVGLTGERLQREWEAWCGTCGVRAF
jgi:hypothetical protein